MREPISASGAHLESIWDYPIPPRVESFTGHIQVLVEGVAVADTRRALRVLEKGHPPVYYLPPEDVRMDLLNLAPNQTWCEWKGQASYYDLLLGERRISEVAWSYLTPMPDYEAIRAYLAFYPRKVDACLVDGERAAPEPGDIYGGWITRSIQGPFRGE